MTSPFSTSSADAAPGALSSGVDPSLSGDGEITVLVEDNGQANDEFVPAKTSRTFDIVVAAISLAVSLVLLTLSMNVNIRAEVADNVGPRWWPTILASALTALAILMLIFAVFRAPIDRSDTAAATRLGWQRLPITVLLTGSFFWAWPVVGFIPATFVYVLLLILLFGARTWKTVVLFPVGMTALLYVLFHLLLRVPL